VDWYNPVPAGVLRAPALPSAVYSGSGALKKLLTKPVKLKAMLEMKSMMKQLSAASYEDPDRDFCYSTLLKVSRSFAMVIQQLHPCLRDAVCVFYLVLRALDTVEDEMHNISLKWKLSVLPVFYTWLASPEAALQGVGVGDGEYLHLMNKLDSVQRLYAQLPPQFQAVILDITKRMGCGMIRFLERDVKSVQEYNLYCHFVAGLVGLGLSDLFVASGLEGPNVGRQVTLSNGMGLLLQKTNIIRDYKEDIDDGRLWWPSDVWSKYVPDAADFQKPEKAAAALACLNEMVADSLCLLPLSISYLKRLRDPTVFNFCAVPQLMAVATLCKCYNNPAIFHRVVKISKADTCLLIKRASEGLPSVLAAFHELACEFKSKLDPCDAQFEQMNTILQSICHETAPDNLGRPPMLRPGLVAGVAVASAVAGCANMCL